MPGGISVALAGRLAIGNAEEPMMEAELGMRARVALAYLVVERRRPVARGELAEAVWGEDLPTTWRASLRGIVSRVRGALVDHRLDDVVLSSGPAGYQLQFPAGATVDVEVAAVALGTARAAMAEDERAALAEARRAVELSEGEFLGGAGSGAWVEQRQDQLARLHVDALELASEAARRCGETKAAVWAAEEAAGACPWRESAHRSLMAAHAADGNRADALRAYERCRHALVEELGVDPSPETEAAYLALLGADSPTRRADHDGPRRHNMPAPPSSFVGRAAERQELDRLLGTGRLVTVTGLGGAGKSRLALEVAKHQKDAFRDGVWLVELAGLGDARLTAAHVLGALGLPDSPGCSALQSLAGHLADRQMLLALDNCEHLVESVAELAAVLLHRCRDLRVLATSREPLGVSGEVVWPVPPLSTPPSGEGLDLDALLCFDAARLFVDRARASAPGLSFAEMTEAITEICVRLDGIPLALELAAARARQMAVPEIARRLQDRFRLLDGGPRTAPARHQTLRAALDWSCGGLTDSERRVFAAVSVFGGAFGAEAAEAVCEAEDVVRALSGLVDKSLIVANRSGPATRYRLLETVREYAALLLVGSAAETSARVGVTRWAIDLMDAAEPGLEGPEQATWLAVLDAEHDNLLGLLDWAVSHTEPSDGLQIAASMWRYWEMRGLLSEGRSYLERLLGVGADRSCAVRAKALASAGVLAQNQADLGAARGFYQEALEMHGSLGDDLGVATALNGLGTVAVGDNDLLGARTLFEQNLGTSRRLADERMIAASLMNLGVVLQLLLASGRIDRREGADQAEGCYRESLELYRGLGNRHGVASALENLGVVAPYRDDYEGAQALLEESLVLRRDLQDRSGIAASARFLGHLALRTRQFDHARRLHQECLSIERELGNPYLMAADLVSLAEIAEAEGDGPEAHELLERALALYQGLGDRAAAKRVAEGQGRVARFERHTPVGDPRRPEHAPALATAEPDAGDARLPAQAMYSPRRR